MSVYMSIDWSKKKHDLVVLDEGGKVIAQTVIPRQRSGFRQLDETRAAMNVGVDACLVGMETAHNVLIDYLWGRGYHQVYVVPLTVVRSSREQGSCWRRRC